VVNKIQSQQTERQFLGLPMVLIWGYVAVAIFMTGDGVEQAFLSKYIGSLGLVAQKLVEYWLFMAWLWLSHHGYQVC